MTNTKLRSFLIRTLADPVLIYTVLVMMTIMYHYRSSLTLIYGIAAYAIGWLVFRLFDYMQKHSIIGFFLYVVLFAGFMWSAQRMIDLGSIDYPISWGLWFLTPVDLVEYNKWYTLAIFILFLIFMLSVIYYFTRVRYRILMNFVIFIIPFSIYGKEYEKMPIYFILLMAVGYILIMMQFRQLKEAEDEVWVIEKPVVWKSAAVFTVLFALIAAIIPKPQIEADREMIETLINAEAFTDRLDAMLNVFRDTTGGDQFRNDRSSTPLFYGDAEEPLRLKNASYSYYDYDTDSWKISYLDSGEYEYFRAAPVDFWGNGLVAEAVVRAAQMNSDFAENYGLEEYAEKGIDSAPLRTLDLVIMSPNAVVQSAPVPQFAKRVTELRYGENMTVSTSGLLLADDGRFTTYENFTFEYFADTFFGSEINRAFAAHMAEIDYAEMLNDAYYILSSEHLNDSMGQEFEELYEAAFYNCYLYPDFVKELLDYGGNERIKSLADEITAGCETEYEKARALEWYFYRNGYTYDMEYQKALGANAETFLFDSKTGVCYEYATSMVLLARAAGIPARYCEGYNMQEKSTVYEGVYVVTGSDAHGFPELYIKGYGWMSFEPTMTDDVKTKDRKTTNLLSRAGIILLIFAAAALLIILLYPILAHKFFSRINSKRQPDQAVRAAFRRICRLYGINRTKTSHEAAEIVMRRSGADISVSAELFDRLVYGGGNMTEEDRQKIMEEYNAAYLALKETKKKKRRKSAK